MQQTKVARQRLSVLQLAEVLGNTAEACRRLGMDRTSFFEWRRRFQTHGIEGLKDLPPIHKSHPQTTAPETVARILDLALTHPVSRLQPVGGHAGPRRRPALGHHHSEAAERS